METYPFTDSTAKPIGSSLNASIENAT
jgi:hypothetical protein